MSNLDIPSKFTNKGTIINRSIGYDGKVTLGIEDNQGTIAYNVGNMTELHLPNLKTSTGTIATGCPKLSVLSLPELEIIDLIGYDRISLITGNSPQIVIFPSLKKILSTKQTGYGAEIIRGSNTTKSIIFGCLSEIRISRYTGDYTPYFCNQGLLNKLIFNETITIFNGMEYMLLNSKYCCHLEFGHGMEITIRLNSWYPTNALKADSSDLVEDTSICSNNLEQFLYNFREYIIKRLATKSSKTYIYLHATTKSYILGEDESHYAQTWIVPGESDTYINTLNDELTTRNWGLA